MSIKRGSISAPSDIGLSLEELELEAKSLFNVLDSKSTKIIQLETTLRKLKAHFPYQLKIKEDSLSSNIPPEGVSDLYSGFEGYFTQTCWYLAWESAEDNKTNYRLFLVAEEKGIVHFNYNDSNITKEFKSTRASKQAFIETDLPTRLQCSKYLDSLSL